MSYEKFTNRELLCYAHYLQSGQIRLYPQYILEAGKMIFIPEEERTEAFPPYGAIYVIGKADKIDRHACGKTILAAVIPTRTSLLTATIPNRSLLQNYLNTADEDDRREFDEFKAGCDSEIKIRPYQYTHSYPVLPINELSQELLKRHSISFDNSSKVLNESSGGIYFCCNDAIVGPCSFSFEQENIILDGGLEEYQYQVKLYEKNSLKSHAITERNGAKIMSFIAKDDVEHASASNVLDYLTHEQKVSILIKCLEKGQYSRGIENTRNARNELKHILAYHPVLSVNRANRLALFDSLLSETSDLYSDIHDSVCNNIRNNETLADRVIKSLANQGNPESVVEKLFIESDSLSNTYLSKQKSKEILEKASKIEQENTELRRELQSYVANINSTEVTSETDNEDLIEAKKQIAQLQKKVEEQQKEYAILEKANGNIEDIETKIREKKKELEQKSQDLQKVTDEFTNRLEEKLKTERKRLESKIADFSGSAKTIEDKFADIYGEQFGQMLEPIVQSLIGDVQRQVVGIGEKHRGVKERILAESCRETEEQKNTPEPQSIALEQFSPESDARTAGKRIIEIVGQYLQQRGRDIDESDIANYLICLTQGFITTFAGKPGSGKTSLCNLLAEALGLKTDAKNPHFVDVSVGRGWSSHKDFIGFYNPITEKIVKANEDVYDALVLSNKEECTQAPPMVIMLDEANLSPLEHYWSAFLKNSDLDFGKNKKISIGADQSLGIQEHLRFLATINHDHTTEELSPRFLDRSWVIKLDDTYEDVPARQNAVELPDKAIPYSALKKAFGADSFELPSETLLEKWRKVKKELQNLHLDVMGRCSNMVINYVCAAKHYMVDESTALDYAVAQKVLPQLTVYGAEYKQKIKDAAMLCNNLSMRRCHKLLSDIAESSNMDVYQFFAR